MKAFIDNNFNNDNISKKLINRELSEIENKYKLNDNISKYYSNQWFKYLQNKSTNYKYIPINKCTNMQWKFSIDISIKNVTEKANNNL